MVSIAFKRTEKSRCVYVPSVTSSFAECPIITFTIRGSTRLSANSDAVMCLVSWQVCLLVNNFSVISFIVRLQEAKLIAEEDTEKWLEEFEKKELPAIKELKDGLTDLGADKADYDSITGFAKALEHPVRSSNGKVYVEIPNPEKTLPVLKKMMKKLTSVIEKTKDIARKISGHVG